MKIPLFDIDGTLFRVESPIHDNAFSFAFDKVYKQPATIYEIQCEGMTDSQIIVEVLKLRGIDPKETRKKLQTAIQAMVEYFAEHKREVNTEALPGVKDLLFKLKARNIPVGVLTGNVEEIGWTKIENAGLRNLIEFGAFGDKTEVRSELVEIARENAEIQFNKVFNTNNFVIIGDTPRDIQCARDTGIKVIAVATGIFPYDELVEYKPNLLVHTLEDQKVYDFISS